MPIVTFLPRGLKADVESGLSILDAARRAGIELESPCNGLGTCGKCKVKVTRVDSTDPSRTQADGDHVLACEARVITDEVVVTIPEVVRGRDRVLLTGQRATRQHRPLVSRQYDRSSDTTRFYRNGLESGIHCGDVPCLGIAVDIGTTTVVVSLLDLESGKELGTLGALNPQARLGHDVLTRIQIASDEGGLAELCSLIIDELARLINEVTRKSKVHPSAVQEIILSGNTTMLHLATRTNPKSLGRYPYTPVLRGHNGGWTAGRC
jgi:uncharacterized 2Fe-2S/4Fe-4S cluster protein (DUF4445 family)